MTPIGRPPRRAASRRASWSGQRQNASIVEMLPSVSELPSATTPPASSGATHIDAADKEPFVGQIADRHHRGVGEIARRRDVVGLPRIAPGDLEIGQHLAGQIEADREIGERRHVELDRIAERSAPAATVAVSLPPKVSLLVRARQRRRGPCRAPRCGRRRSPAGARHRRSRSAPAAVSPPRLTRGIHPQRVVVEADNAFRRRRRRRPGADPMLAVLHRFLPSFAHLRDRAAAPPPPAIPFRAQIPLHP